MGYITRELEFTDFITEKDFQSLKGDFRLLPLRDQPSLQELEMVCLMPDFKIKMDDFIDEFGRMEEQIFFFLKDYLYPNITKMANLHYKKFQRDIDEKSIYHTEALENYAKKVINDQLKWFSEIEEAHFLDGDIKKRVLQQLERLIQDIQNHVKYPLPYAEAKLKFKWNKADVLYFFHLLRENKQIEYLSNSAFAQIIDNLVEYSDGETFSPINDSRKRFSSYNQLTPPIVTESKKRLMSIFCKSDFYKE